jgi:hypothetical protein
MIAQDDQGIEPLAAEIDGESVTLRALTVEQVKRIDDALIELGPFAEVRLIKAKGKLRFIQLLESRSLI